MSKPRTEDDMKENFLLRRLNESGFVTSFYEDAQDEWPPLEQLWVPHKKSAAKYPPALYYTKAFMKSRVRFMKQSDPFCMHGQSSNQVHVNEIIFLKGPQSSKNKLIIIDSLAPFFS